MCIITITIILLNLVRFFLFVWFVTGLFVAWPPFLRTHGSYQVINLFYYYYYYYKRLLRARKQVGVSAWSWAASDRKAYYNYY